MNRTVISLLALAFALTSMQCERAETFRLGEPFSLQIGEEKQSEDKKLSVKWLQLVEDSRCPIYTNCVWEGQAKVSLRVADASIELILRDGHPAEAVQTISGYEVRALSLTPYPEAGQNIEEEMYRLELQVNKQEP